MIYYSSWNLFSYDIESRIYSTLLLQYVNIYPLCLSYILIIFELFTVSSDRWKKGMVFDELFSLTVVNL